MSPIAQSSTVTLGGGRGAALSRRCVTSTTGSPATRTPCRMRWGWEAEMAVAVVSGSGGLIGSEAVRHLVAEGWDVVGLENDMRASFFGPDASTAHVTQE